MPLLALWLEPVFNITSRNLYVEDIDTYNYAARPYINGLKDQQILGLFKEDKYMMGYVDTHNILCPQQHRFQSKHSC